jgi:hypothetical protein
LTSTSRSALYGAVARFRPEDGEFFLVDNIKVAFSPSTAALRARFVCAEPALVPGDLSDTRQLGLEESAPLAVRDSRRGIEISWASSGAKFQQSLGHFGRRGNVTLTADWNPIRAVRSGLSEAQQRAHERQDNYLDRSVIGLADGQRLCFAALEDAIPTWQVNYARILRTVWALPIDPEDVHVSLNLIELAWDAHTPHTASLGARLFLHEWNRSIAESKHAFEVERLEHYPDGALRGIGLGGEHLKLYRKTHDFLRFEAQISRQAGNKILRAACEKADKPSALDLDHLPTFFQNLRTIAGRVYPTILGVQEAIVIPPPSGIPLMLSKMARKSFERDVVEDILNNGAVKCRDQNMYRFLRTLSRDGLVQKGPGKGMWSATRSFEQELRLLRRARENQAKWLES